LAAYHIAAIIPLLVMMRNRTETETEAEAEPVSGQLLSRRFLLQIMSLGNITIMRRLAE
jgi:hypothetical protein